MLKLNTFTDLVTGRIAPALFSAILATVIATIFIGSAQPAQAANQAAGRATDRTILAFVRHYEARGNYDSYYTGIRTAPPKPLTQMTVGAVMAWQAGLKNTRSTAAGGYQIIKATLAKLVKKHRIDRTALYDVAMQDRLGAHLIANCQNRANTPAFANCLAGIWAALPRVTGARRGRSNYHGIAGNRALTTPENLLAMLEGRRFNLRTRARPRLNLAAFGATPFKISVTSPALAPRTTTVSRRDRIREAMGQAGTGITRTYTFDPYVLE